MQSLYSPAWQQKPLAFPRPVILWSTSFITNQTAKKTAAQSRYAAVSKSKMTLNNTWGILPDEFTKFSQKMIVHGISL